MATGLVKARWVPLYEVELVGGRRVAPGEIAEIPAAEAEASDNWEVVRGHNATSPAKPKDDEE